MTRNFRRAVKIWYIEHCDTQHITRFNASHLIIIWLMNAIVSITSLKMIELAEVIKKISFSGKQKIKRSRMIRFTFVLIFAEAVCPLGHDISLTAMKSSLICIHSCPQRTFVKQSKGRTDQDKIHKSNCRLRMRE